MYGETGSNLLCLSPLANAVWDAGAYTLKPISVSEDGSTLTLRIFWQNEREPYEPAHNSVIDQRLNYIAFADKPWLYSGGRRDVVQMSEPVVAYPHWTSWLGGMERQLLHQLCEGDADVMRDGIEHRGDRASGNAGSEDVEEHKTGVEPSAALRPVEGFFGICGGFGSEDRAGFLQDRQLLGERKLSQDEVSIQKVQLVSISPATVTDSPEERTVIQRKASLNNAQSTDRLSLIKRLEGFCNRIKAHREGNCNEPGRYLSDEAIRLVSRIWDFMHARIPEYQSTTTTTTSEETIGSMDTVRHYLAALMVLNETLETANPVALLGITTFAFFEVCDGAFGEWQCHLYGARSLLDHHCRSRRDLDRLSQDIIGLTEIVAHLVWFDAIGAIIRGSTGLIFDDWHRETLDESFFSGVGCPAETFDLFVDLAKVNVATDPLGFSIRAMDQLLKLDLDGTDRGQSANAYRCTAAIAVLSRMDDVHDINLNISLVNPRCVALASAVDRVCEAIALIPLTSRFFTHLAVTAYMAGLNATTVQQCEIVRAYWQNCRSADFTHYLDAQARCEERWRAAGLQ
ncbi:hypothetical protein B7463_g4209, partial [Scytalidium lignicola]